MTDNAELVVKVRADASSLSSEMKKAESAVTGSAKRMESGVASLTSSLRGLVPAIGIAAMVNYAKSALAAADRLNDLAQRTGVAASTLSALNIPLMQGGASVDEFAVSINKMNNMIGEAAKGESQGLIDTFNDLGLSIEKLMQLTPEQQFYEIATALNKIENQAEFTNTGMAIFGRSFSTLAPLIRESNGELASFVEKQKESGDALTEEELKRIDEWGDRWTGAIEGATLKLTRFLLLLGSAFEFEGQPLPPYREDFIPIRKGNPNETAREELDRLVGEFNRKQKATVYGEAFNYPQMPSRSSAAGVNANAKKTGASAPYEMTAGDINFLNTAAEAAEAKTRAEKEAAEATKKAAEATERFNEVITQKLSAGLTEAVFSANSAGDAFKRMAMSIAQSIFEQSVARPFASGISNAINGSGISSSIGSFFGDMLPSFDVGSNNIPNDMIAKVHKGEMIIPAQQANQIRNGSMGGVTVMQNFTINAGVSAEVRNQVAQAAPMIAQAAKNAVFNEIQSGGRGAKIVGVR